MHENHMGHDYGAHLLNLNCYYGHTQCSQRKYDLWRVGHVVCTGHLRWHMECVCVCVCVVDGMDKCFTCYVGSLGYGHCVVSVRLHVCFT